MGLAEHGPGQAGDRDDQQHHQGAEPPVQEQRERQQHEQRDEGREVLAQERQPHPKQRVGALPHDLELAPRMGGRRGRRAAAAGRVRGTGSSPPAGGAGQRRSACSATRMPAPMLPMPIRPHEPSSSRICCQVSWRGRAAAAGERVDDAAEQQGAEEGGCSEGRVGQDQRDRKAPLRSEQDHHATVQPPETHLQNERSVPISIARFAQFPQASCVPRAQPKLTQTP